MAESESTTLSFTRQQFYERLWSIPTTAFAKELGCSDVMVGKVCRAFGIPKPYLGYWARLEHGKKPAKTPLPKNDDPGAQTLTFVKAPECPKLPAVPAPEPPYDHDICQMLEKAQSLPPVSVPTALSKPHHLVAAARAHIIENRRPWRSSFDRQMRGPFLTIEVSESALSRALCIMDTLIKRVEALGGSVDVELNSYNRRPDSVVKLANEDVTSIRIREKHNQVRLPPNKKRNIFDSNTVLEPTGMLILDCGASCFAVTLLADTPKRRQIEDGLNELIIGLVRKAGDIRIRRRNEEAARKLREEEDRVRRIREDELRRQREEPLKRQKAEQARVDELVHHATSWRKTREIRDYLAAVTDQLLERDGSIGLYSEVANYLRWAHQQADRLDPLKPSPPSILDQ